jgi:regulator of protease activity HflC (stomatin/prohibitin superfamily)
MAMIYLSIQTLEITAVILVAILFVLAISIHYVPKDSFWQLKNKKGITVIYTGFHFIIPFYNKITYKGSTLTQTHELYLSQIQTADSLIDFKIDYSFEVIDPIRYDKEINLDHEISNSLIEYVLTLDNKSLLCDNNTVSDRIYLHIKEIGNKNGLQITKITIYFE